MSRGRVVICRVENEEAGERTTEVARFDLPETDLRVVEPGTGLDALEEITHQHGQAAPRGVLQAQWEATEAVAAQRRRFPPCGVAAGRAGAAGGGAPRRAADAAATGAGDAEPRRVRGRLSLARGATRPLPVQGPCRLSLAGAGDHGAAPLQPGLRRAAPGRRRFAPGTDAGAARGRPRRHATLETLKTRGVIPIDVPADRLTPEVINTYLDLKARGRV